MRHDADQSPTEVIPAELIPHGVNLIIAGRYEAISKLGRGGFGVVYRAHDRRLGRQVAIKLLNESCDPQSSQAARFLREAKILASLDHPNIVPIYDADLDGDHFYIAMKYVAGQSLCELIRERPIPEAEALQILAAMAAGLAHAHDCAVLHRDVKPSNALIGEKGDVFLVDFGLSSSQARSSQNLKDQIAGSLPYMAPEVLSGQTSEPSDIYGLGTVLYEVLFRELCFKSTTTPALIGQILREDPPCLACPTRDLSPPVFSLLKRLLDKDPEKRPQRAAEVAEEATAILRTVTRTTHVGIVDSPASTNDPAAMLEAPEKALEDLVAQCEREHPKTDKIIECFSQFLTHGGSLIESLERAFLADPDDPNCPILTLSLEHLAREVRERMAALAPDGDGGESAASGAIAQLDSRILAPSRRLLRRLEGQRDAQRLPAEDFFAFADELAHNDEAADDADWIDQLFSRKEVDRHDALLFLVGDGRDIFLAELAANSDAARNKLLAALWTGADVVLLEGKGRTKPIFAAAASQAPDPSLQANWRQLFALFQKNESGYWDPEMVAQMLHSKSAEDRRVFARALMIHPWAKYRELGLGLLKPPDFWYLIASEKTPLSSILEIWRHLKPRVKTDYLKIFFVSVNDRLRQSGPADRALVAMELVKEFYQIDSFHESFFFKTLTSLEEAVREEARRHRYPIELDKEYVTQMKRFLSGQATQDQPVQGWGHVPLPVQRILARRGYFQTHFSCHPIDPIALECLKHVLAREDISAFLKLYNINMRLLGEIAKDKLHFREEKAKYLLVANPKTQPFVVAKHIGYLRGDNLRALANSRQCNSYAREHAARLLKKKETVRGLETAGRKGR